MKKNVFILIIFLSIGSLNQVFADKNSNADSLSHIETFPHLDNSAIDFAASNKTALFNSSKIHVMEALFGQIPGFNITQGKGFSYSRNPDINLHGFSPLILIDGVPRDVDNMIIDEVADIIVYKDAVAAALYGVRGARGVVNIITKRGVVQSKLIIETSYQFGASSKFRSPHFADAHTYAKALNTAPISDGLREKYSALELDAFKNNLYPDAYANVDWYNETFSDLELNHQFTFNVRGGQEKFDYYALVAYSKNEGLFKHHNQDERYNNQLLDTRLTLRTNFRVDVTKTTEFIANLQAQLKEFNSPNSTNQILQSAYRIPSAAFPIRTDNIWGGNNIYSNTNPVALLSSNGHYKTMVNSVTLDVNLRQKLDMLLDGLSVNALFAIDNSGSLYEQSILNYRYIDNNPNILVNGDLTTSPNIYGSDSETLDHGSGINSTFFNTYFNGDINYRRSIGFNNYDASIHYNMQTNMLTGQNQSRKRQSIAAYFSYNYSGKYFVDAVATYGGSSVIQLGKRFDIYPAVSGAWIISEEDFFTKNFIDFLKIKSSIGYSAWDATTPYDIEKIYYTSGKPGYVATGSTGSPISKGGWGESNLPTQNLKLEKVRKFTVGADVGMIDSKLSVNAHAFYDKWYNGLIDIGNTTSGILGLSSKNQNDGVSKYSGFDLGINWRDIVGDFSYEVGGVLAFTQSELIENNEGFKPYDYLSRKGNSVSQVYGLEADGFFEDQMDINNSPAHSFYNVRPGDIKYKDQNGDNIINDNDIVRMMAPRVPELYYGFNLKLDYKNVQLYANFQGVGNHTVSLLNSSLYKPLVDNYTISNTFLENEVFWTPENSSIATMPRLTTLSNDNNYRQSSHWYRNASYLKLRDVRISYSFEKMIKLIPSIEVYLAGNNLFSIDKIGFADPESIEDNYPTLRSFWAGVNIKF